MTAGVSYAQGLESWTRGNSGSSRQRGRNQSIAREGAPVGLEEEDVPQGGAI